MQKLIVANWKYNPVSVNQAVSLAKKIDAGIPKKKNIEVVIAPPFPFLIEVGKALRRAKLGAQDAFWENQGAYTGEVSPSMLKNSGVEYVIIGHSERRKFLHETEEMINKKVLASLKVGLKVILCVGEPERMNNESGIMNNGLRKAKDYIKKQLEKDLKGIHNSKFIIHDSLIIAYEPIWAIGTGKPDKPENAAEMIKFIKSFLYSKFYILNSRVLYGGSVNSQNAANFLCHKEIDGALVGSASLKHQEFKKIIGAVSSATYH